MRRQGGPFTIRHSGCSCSRRYRGTSGGQPMRAFYLEISAKLIIRSDTDPDELPADIYSHLAEFIRSDEDIIDIEVQAIPLPPDLCGSAPH